MRAEVFIWRAGITPNKNRPNPLTLSKLFHLARWQTLYNYYQTI